MDRSEGGYCWCYRSVPSPQLLLECQCDLSLTSTNQDDNLLVNKANKHVLEPLTRRIDRVQAFLTSFKPSLEYHIVPIQDVYGPTAVDPNIQALVVSKETLSGGAASRLILPNSHLVDSDFEIAHS